MLLFVSSPRLCSVWLYIVTADVVAHDWCSAALRVSTLPCSDTGGGVTTSSARWMAAIAITVPVWLRRRQFRYSEDTTTTVRWQFSFRIFVRLPSSSDSWRSCARWWSYSGRNIRRLTGFDLWEVSLASTLTSYWSKIGLEKLFFFSPAAE